MMIVTYDADTSYSLPPRGVSFEAKRVRTLHFVLWWMLNPRIQINRQIQMLNAYKSQAYPNAKGSMNKSQQIHSVIGNPFTEGHQM